MFKVKKRIKKNIISVCIMMLVSSMTSAASESPQSFTFQGRLFNASGTYPLEEQVVLGFQILDPSANCLLYEETQVVDLTHTSGVFAVSVGSTVAAAKRTIGVDPGFSMSKIFKNDPLMQTRAAHATCPAGYTPTSGDHRLLRVTVIPQVGSPDVLSPDQIINSVPHAIVAETLQGLAPMDFIQKDLIYITDANVQKLFGSATGVPVDASDLHHHDGRYIQISSSSSQDLGSGGFNTSGKGSVGSSVNFTNTTLSVKSGADTDVGLAIRAGSAGQSADLFQVQDNAGTKLMGVNASGGLTSTQSTITSTAGNQFAVKYDNTNQLTLDVNSTGASTFTGTGTDPKFSFMGGNVGIGVTSPNYRLHVDAPSGGTAVLLTAGGSSSLGAGTGIEFQYGSGTPSSNRIARIMPYGLAGGGGNLLFQTAAGAGSSYVTKMIVERGGNVGIGTTSPGSPLQVSGATHVATSGTEYGMQITPTYNQASSTAANTDLLINRTQTAVGSGPQSLIDAQVDGVSKFSVFSSGTVRVTGYLSVGSYLNAPGTNVSYVKTQLADNTLTLQGNSFSSANKVAVNVNPTSVTNTSGTFSAMTITPTYNQASGTSANTDLLINRAQTAIGSGAQKLIDAQVGGVSKFNVDNSGNAYYAGSVGIGMTSPGYKLHVVGSSGATVGYFSDGAQSCSITPATAGNISCSSDERLKQDIKAFSDSTSLENILKLQTVTYEWKSVANGRHTGYIAQEVERIAPEFVTTGKDGYKQVSYTGFIPWITGAIKEVHNKFLGHEAELEALKAENAMMKSYLCNKDPRAPFCKK